MGKSSHVAALALATVAATGCGNSRGANVPGANPERQSEAEYDLARDFFYKGETRVALDHARRAVELDDENAHALYFAAIIHLSFCSSYQGLRAPDCNLMEAEKYARLAIKADDQFRDAKNTLGAIYILEKKCGPALETLGPLTKDQAYEASYLAWANLGWAQVMCGKLDDGIASLTNSVTEPRFCVGHYRLGVAWEKRGELDKAEQSFTNAVNVDSPDCQDLQDAWEARARVRLKLGKTADARQDFERCRDIAADSPVGKSCAQALR
jgi:type IV pilus assembly protein PilF